MIRRLFAAGIAFLTVSCHSGWDTEEERFAQTYAEILVVRELYPDTALGNARVRTLLRQYGYRGEEEFRQHFLTFAREPARLRRILDSAATRAERMLQDSLRYRPR